MLGGQAASSGGSAAQGSAIVRKEPEHFDGIDPVLVYVARKLRHAQRAEALLTGAGIDYAVETDVVSVGFILRSERMGAFFYVAPPDEVRAREALAREGFTLTVTEDRR